MHALVFGKARMAARTLIARAGGVWMWPGIALTERPGVAAEAPLWLRRAAEACPGPPLLRATPHLVRAEQDVVILLRIP